MNARLAALIVTICLSAGEAFAQAPVSLSRQQRELLHAVVLAVDAAAVDPQTSGAIWQLHVMRASDGSHYVAFSVQPPAALPVPAGPAVLYVRLAHAASSAQPAIARSPIREWLAGEPAAPPPVRRAGLVLGEMPVLGATANLEGRGAGSPTTPGMVDLQLQALERRRAREREEERRRSLGGRAGDAA